MIVIDSYIAPSPIHGKGLFSSGFIPTNSLIWIYNPAIDQLIPSNLINNFSKSMKDYIIHFSVLLDSGHYIFSRDNSIYLNHSNDPCIIKRGPLGYGLAARDISPNTEITTNYREWSSHTPKVLW